MIFLQHLLLAILSGCSYNGIQLSGKFQVVEHFPDIKVKVVNHNPTLKVKLVNHFPNQCGEWKEVKNFPELLPVPLAETFSLGG